MAKKPPSILGRWRIIEMPDFEQDYVDTDGPAYIQFNKDDHGEFHFGYVHGNMDSRYRLQGGRLNVDWSWDGNDEHHPAMGRGWAEVGDDGKLRGIIFFHDSDDFDFVAEGRKPLKPSKQAGKRIRIIRNGKVTVGRLKPPKLKNLKPRRP